MLTITVFMPDNRLWINICGVDTVSDAASDLTNDPTACVPWEPDPVPSTTVGIVSSTAPSTSRATTEPSTASSASQATTEPSTASSSAVIAGPSPSDGSDGTNVGVIAAAAVGTSVVILIVIGISLYIYFVKCRKKSGKKTIVLYKCYVLRILMRAPHLYCCVCTIVHFMNFMCRILSRNFVNL